MATSSPFLPVGSRAALATRLQAMLLYLPPPPIQPPVRLDFLSLLDGDKTIYASDTPNRALTGGHARNTQILVAKQPRFAPCRGSARRPRVH
jgi:hypothetical protein